MIIVNDGCLVGAAYRYAQTTTVQSNLLWARIPQSFFMIMQYRVDGQAL